MAQAIPKTPQTLASEIHIKALDNSAYFLLLEGDFDMRFWETRLNPIALRPIGCGGKPVVSEMLNQLHGQPLGQRVLGLLDADFDRLLDRSQPPRVVYTDEADLETTLMLLQCSLPAQMNMERLIAATVDVEKRNSFERQKGFTLVEQVRRVASQFGVLRLLNEQQGWNMAFRDMSVLNQQWFDRANLMLNNAVLHQSFSEKLQAQGHSIDQVQLSSLIQVCAQRGWLSGWQLVQGHDLLAVLAAAMNSDLLRRASGHQQISEASLQRDLLLMHWHDLQTCRMIHDLTAAMPQGASCFRI